MTALRNPSSTLPGKSRSEAGPEVQAELDSLRAENGQLRSLCVELEQALQEAATQTGSVDLEAEVENRLREYEDMLEQKSETIRQLHQEIQRSQALVAELEGQLATFATSRPTYSGPAPREDELMRLADELERERRQLQEDEQTLMEQMREMEVGLARERADLARQKNDLARLQTDVRHEIERLEKSGAVQNKLDQLKAKLHDATTRRGMAPSSGQQQTAAEEEQPVEQKPRPSKGILGRLFGG